MLNIKKYFFISLITAFCTPQLFALDFAPLKELKVQDSLYAKTVNKGSINYSIYISKDITLPPGRDVHFYDQAINKAFDDWFNGIWRMIPQGRKGEFSDLKDYFLKPRINSGGSIEHLLAKADNAKEQIIALMPNLNRVSPLNNSKADMAFFIVPEATIEHICGDNALACYVEDFIFLQADFENYVLLHEIGHLVGLADQYISGLYNAQTEFATSSLKEDSLMAAKSNNITCDEADGAIFLFDCVLGLGNNQRVWDSICKRNIRIENCKIVKTQNYLLADESYLKMPLYEGHFDKMTFVEARNNASGPADYNIGFNPYIDFDLGPVSGKFTKTGSGVSAVRIMRKGGNTIYSVDGAHKIIPFNIRSEIKHPFDIPSSMSSIFTVGGWENSVLLSFTLKNKGKDFVEFTTFHGKDSRMFLRFDAKGKEVFDSRSSDKKNSIKRVIFTDDDILLAESDYIGGIFTLIHYEYGSFEPVLAEYFYLKKQHITRKIKKTGTAFKAGDIVNGIKGKLSESFIEKMSDMPGSYYISAYSYGKDDSEFVQALNIRLKDNSFIKQAAKAYERYIGRLPGKAYNKQMIQQIKSGLKDRHEVRIIDEAPPL